MSEISTTVILAAGYGKRLKPFTDFLPKPAMPVANVPSIVKIIDNLHHFNISTFHINTHHLPEVVVSVLKSDMDATINVTCEHEIRGTGGGVENFRSALQSQPFILHNADIYSEQDLQELLDYHQASDSLVTLMGVDEPEFNSLVVDDEGLVDISRKDGTLTYSGIAVFSPAVWKYFPCAVNFSLVDVFRSVMRHKLPIKVFKSAAYWNDFGTVARYFDLHANLAVSYPLNIHPQAVVSGCDLRGFCFVATGCEIRDCLIEDSIILPGTKMEGKQIKSSVALADIIMPVNV